MIVLLDGLTAEQWQRRGIHQARGRMRLDEWVASLAVTTTITWSSCGGRSSSLDP